MGMNHFNRLKKRVFYRAFSQPRGLPRMFPRGTASALILVCIVILTFLLYVLFVRTLLHPVVGKALFWIFLLLAFVIIWAILGAPEKSGKHRKQTFAEEEKDEALPVTIPPENWNLVVQNVVDIKLAVMERGLEVYKGPLRMTSRQAFEFLKEKFAGTDRCVFLQEAEGLRVAVVLMPRPAAAMTPVRRPNYALHWLLFFITFLTTTYAGAVHAGMNPLSEPSRLTAGLPYSFGLMLILGFHELGHYFTARRYGMNVTPPFFIPVPFGLGTFGAFIQMKSPSEHRCTMFDVSIAGPIAGLLAAIPALIIGLKDSKIISENPLQLMLHARPGLQPESSILMSILCQFALGERLATGHSLILSPLAFAGWLGLLVTALNLVPIGQLDGGHIVHAMFGQRAGKIISTVSMWMLFLLAVFVYPGLLLFAIIVFFLAGARGVPPLDDITPIDPARRLLGYLAFLILFLILVPVPEGLHMAEGAWNTYL